MCWMWSQIMGRIWKQTEKQKEDAASLETALTIPAPSYLQLPSQILLIAHPPFSMCQLPVPTPPQTPAHSSLTFGPGAKQVSWHAVCMASLWDKNTVFWQLGSVKSFFTRHVCVGCLTWEEDNKAVTGMLCRDRDGPREKWVFLFQCQISGTRSSGNALGWDKPGTGEKQHGTFSPGASPASDLLIPKGPWTAASAGVSRKGDSSKLLNPFLFISTTAQSLRLGRRVGRGSDQTNHLQVLKVVLCALHFGLCTCYSLNPECPQPSSSAPLAILYIFQEPTQISTPLGSLSLFLRSTDNILLCASNIAWSFSRHKHLRDR